MAKTANAAPFSTGFEEIDDAPGISHRQEGPWGLGRSAEAETAMAEQPKKTIIETTFFHMAPFQRIHRNLSRGSIEAVKPLRLGQTNGQFRS